ncbi:MAG: polyphosphate polymerase domain-containing protein [Oscillospiraceae bacterium]|nr:polyphosphate polymerase domain-containing protein [Oscillospiraceae bacterium]
MKTNQDTFMRYEIKYLVSAEQRAAVMETMNKYMQPDEYGKSTICNIYYDTADMRLVRRSIEKPVYKEKLRVRCYGTPSANDKVFVELKKKYDDVVFKRRVSMCELDAERYIIGECESPKQNQIVSEIDYFISKYRGIVPAAYVSYEREAYFAKDDPNLRITFDENILWRDYDLSLTKGVYGNPLLKEGQSLMEIKVSSSMPLWLTHTLCEQKIYKINFSKYGNAYKTMTGKNIEGGYVCA